MPLDSATLSNNIFMQMKAQGFLGKSDKDLADGISLGLSTYLKTPNLISFQLSGTMGPTGTLSSISYAGLVPSAMSSLMVSRAPFTGKNWKGLCDAISTGFAISFMTSTVSGTTLGIALGTGVGRFISMIDSDLSNRIKSTTAIKQMTGSKKDQMIDAIAFGICTHFKTSVTVLASVTGAVAPVPPAGPVAVSGMPSVFNTII